MLNQGEVTEQILHFLSTYLPDNPLGAPPLISLTPQGIKVNLSDKHWWSLAHPFETVSLLRLLGVPIINRDEIVTWVKQRQHPDGYFKKGRLGIDIRRATYHACHLLNHFGATDPTPDWNRDKLVDLLKAQQQPPLRRHFAFLPKDNKGHYTELDVAFCCIASLHALGETVPHPEAARTYILKKQNDDGTFKAGWVKGAGNGSEDVTLFYAVRCLLLLGGDIPRRDSIIESIRRWRLPDGGYDPLRTQYDQYGKRSDFHSTANAIRTLYLLGAELEAPDQSRAFVESFWQAETGVFMRWYESTFMDVHSIGWTLMGIQLMAILDMVTSPNDLRKLLVYSYW